MTGDTDKPSPIRRLFDPVEIAPLVFFRVACGVFFAFQAFEFLLPRGEGSLRITNVEKHFGYPSLHFKYWGLGWLESLPGDWMYALFVVLLIASVGIAIGLFYRVCVVAFFVGWSFMFFSDTLLYQNHYYLFVLLSFLMIFVPANAAFSIDAQRGAVPRSKTVPAWTLLLLKFQLAVVYIGGGIAKISPDWLAGEPMRNWMSLESRQESIPILGQYFGEEWMVMFFAYSGLFLDLLIVPALLWRKTRLIALAGITLFHLMNSQLWVIGVFPWFMMFATLIFLPPSFFRFGQPAPRLTPDTGPLQLTPRGKAVFVVLAAFVAFQVLFPFRHVLYPGDANWTEEGGRFAWRMKLRTKGGTAPLKFTVTDGSTGESQVVPLFDSLQLLGRIDDRAGVAVAQWRLGYIAIKPDALLQYAHALADKYREAGMKDPQVRVEAMVSMNTRKGQLIIDPTVDLAAQPHNMWPASWITDLTEPLPSRE